MAEPQIPVGPVSLSPTSHKGVKIKEKGSADHIAKSHFAKIYTPEFAKAGTDYPIIFIKNPESGIFFAAGMWGLEPGENLFIEGENWVGGYYPASVRCYPFVVQQDPEDKERLFIGIYEYASVVNKEEGNLIFNEDGTETEWMNGIKEFLVRIYRQEEMTHQFVARLEELELLIPQSLSIKNADNDSGQDISGFYVVDKEKLTNLADDILLEMRKSGELEVIYNHIMSLESLDKLIRKKNLMPMPTPAEVVAPEKTDTPPEGDAAAEKDAE